MRISRKSWILTALIAGALLASTGGVVFAEDDDEDGCDLGVTSTAHHLQGNVAEAHTYAHSVGSPATSAAHALEQSVDHLHGVLHGGTNCAHANQDLEQVLAAFEAFEDAIEDDEDDEVLEGMADHMERHVEDLEDALEID